MPNSKPLLKLNLGCGFIKYPEYVNVDMSPECFPDVVWNIEHTPWPWEDNSVDEIRLEHVLEHVGQTTELYLNIWKEMYRVCANDAVIHIRVPHWNHENFYHDPTHVRAITPIGIAMFDQTRNIQETLRNGSETKLGFFTGVDIDLKPEDIEYMYSGEVVDALNRGEFTREGLDHLRDHQNNISNEIRMKARVVKPARGTAWLKEYKESFAQVVNVTAESESAGAPLSLPEIYKLEQEGSFNEAYEALKQHSIHDEGVPAKIGWHMIRTGDFKNGFPLLHKEIAPWRPEYVFSLDRSKELPKGVTLVGKKICIIPEGGLGDEIIGARFVELYKNAGAYVILVATESLHSIFSRLPIAPDELRTPEEIPTLTYDFWAGSLRGPVYLELDDPSANMTLPYLFPNQEHTEKWAPKITQIAQGKLKIGIRWQGKQPENSPLLRVESVPLQSLLQLRELGQVFSFQQEKAVAELDLYTDIYELGTQLSSWEDTLACMSQMDVMVTCCTSTAHASGALGVPTSVVTTMNPYFTWIGEEKTSAWYPSVRVFRQPYFGGWTEAVTNAKAFIASHMYARPQNSVNAQELFNKAVTAGTVGELDTAEALYREALANAQEESELYHKIRYNLSWYELRNGNLQEGFTHHIDSGRALSFIIKPTSIYPKPYLTVSTDITNKTILLSSESGAGDDILSVRYAKLLKQRGAKKIIWVGKHNLESIFLRVEGIDEVAPQGELTHQDFDYWVLTLELPLILKPTKEEIKRETYITPLPAYAEKWRQKLSSQQGLKVGVRWKGEKNRDISQNRSLPLSYLEKLLSHEGVVPYSFQRDYGSEDLTANSPLINWGEDLETWEDTVGALSQMDIVISSDTSIAHLASAMGKETWVVTRSFPYFAWIPDHNKKSLWYEHARIFNEPTLSTWEVPFSKMEFELLARILNTNTRRTIEDRETIDAQFPNGLTLPMRIHTQNELVSEILRKQHWYSQGDLRLYDILLKEGDTFVDGGANIGWYSLYASTKVGRNGVVLAIEPDPLNFALLEENAKLNNFTQIHAHKVALGNKNSDGRLYKSEFNYGDHFVGTESSTHNSGRESIQTAVVTLDSLLEKEGVTPHFIKLDIQGAESKALEGLEKYLGQETKPYILLEFAPGLMHRNGSSPFELFAFIEKNDFFPFRVYDDYSGQPLLKKVSVEELLEFTKTNRDTEIGWDLLLVHKTTPQEMLERFNSATYS